MMLMLNLELIIRPLSVKIQPILKSKVSQINKVYKIS